MKIEKLCAIYNVWADSIELLEYSIKSIKNHVDLIIIVYQNKSNYGEEVNIMGQLIELMDRHNDVSIEITLFSPHHNQPASFNEKAKRNLGLDNARKNRCSHFLHMDCDEMYQDFGAAKRAFEISGYDGSVLRMHTYFKKPTFMLAEDEKYYVPFIHKLRAGTVAGDGKYPFYVDPTRKINESNVVMLSHYMHHFSWVRKDIDMKIRNSSAKANIDKSHLREDWEKAEAGMFVRDYRTNLVEVPNYFNIEI